MRGFTITELMVSILIMGAMVVSLFGVFDVGKNVYHSNNSLLEKQRMIQQTMGAMTKEIRHSRLSDIVISSGKTQIDFIAPASINPLVYSSNIRYLLVNNQIVREHPPGKQAVLAINIDSLSFDLNGNLLEIEIKVRIPLKTGDMSFTIKEKISLRS